MSTISHKFILIGSVGSGKTTAIQAVSEKPVISTESKATETDALHRKKTTTTAMDYGQVQLEGKKIHLYGAPGQRRFDFMIPILSVGASGMIVVIDNGTENPLEELDYYLKTHRRFLQKNPAMITVTHYDDTCTKTTLFDYHQYVRERGFSLPIMIMDARKSEQVLKTLEKFISVVEKPKIQKKTLSHLKSNNTVTTKLAFS